MFYEKKKKKRPDTGNADLQTNILKTIYLLED